MNMKTQLCALLSAVLLAAGCVETLPLEGSPCPCATGWTCCPGNNSCVAEGQSCTSGPNGPEVTEPRLSLLAGGLGGTGNIDGTAAEARFRSASALALLDGALYIGDQQRLRRLELATSMVTTVAGGSIQGGVVDAIGNEARFGSIDFMASDGAGALYIADLGALRKYDLATGAVSTIAQLQGTVGGIAYDKSGYVYVFQAFGIDRVTLSSGAVSHLAGGMGIGQVDGVGDAAQFGYNTPGVLAYDGEGTLYVGDTGSIRAVDVATAAVTTLTGVSGEEGAIDGTLAEARLGQVGQISIDTVHNFLVFNDGTGPGLRYVNLTSGQVYRSGAFSSPMAVVLGEEGTVYTSQGSLIERAGSVAGVAVGPAPLAGSLAQRGTIDGAGTLARFRNPSRIVADDAGHLFVLDVPATAIRQVDVASGVVSTLAGVQGAAPESVDGPREQARFSDLRLLARDGAGQIFVVDGCAIREVTIASGAVRTIAGDDRNCSYKNGNGAAARFRSVVSIESDGAGNLYIIDQTGLALRKLVVASGEVTTLRGGDSEYVQPSWVNHRALFARGADLFVSTGAVLDVALAKLDPATGALTPVASEVAGLLGSFVVDDQDRAYFFADQTIVRFDLATASSFY